MIDALQCFCYTNLHGFFSQIIKNKRDKTVDSDCLISYTDRNNQGGESVES